MSSLHEIYAALDPKPAELLDNQNRHLVARGTVHLYNERERKHKPRVLLLFNDVLLIAKRLPTAKLRYRLRVYMSLRPAVSASVVEEGRGAGRTQWRIVAPTRTFVLHCDQRVDADLWTRRVNNLCNGRPVDYDAEAAAAEKLAAVQAAKRPGTKKASSKKKAPPPSSSDESSSDASDSSDSSADSTTDDSSDEANDPGRRGAYESDEASSSEDGDGVVRVNPDGDSFVPVLPSQFFTPKSAVAGERVGKARPVGKGKTTSSKAGKAPPKAKASKASAKAAKKQSSASAAAPLVDLLSFDDPPVSSTPASSSPFAGTPTATASPFDDPFGAGVGNPFATPAQAQAPQAHAQFFDPFAPTPAAQQQSSNANPFF